MVRVKEPIPDRDFGWDFEGLACGFGLGTFVGGLTVNVLVRRAEDGHIGSLESPVLKIYRYKIVSKCSSRGVTSLL